MQEEGRREGGNDVVQKFEICLPWRHVFLILSGTAAEHVGVQLATERRGTTDHGGSGVVLRACASYGTGGKGHRF